MLNAPFFFPEDTWIPESDDWSPNLVQGQTYTTAEPIGASIWRQVQERLHYQASHIKPFSQHAPDEVRNGLLLRSNLHILFNRGYLTVDNQLRVEVSSRISETWRSAWYHTRHDVEESWNEVQLGPNNCRDVRR